jgi:hypothetical protein
LKQFRYTIKSVTIQELYNYLFGRFMK